MLQPHRIINKTLADGAVIIRDVICKPTIRLGFERHIPALVGFQRAHTRGAGMGKEYAEGIFYATKEVNQTLQNQGIERFLRELFQEKRKEVILYLTTETRPVPKTLMLDDITYKLDAVYDNREYGIFELCIKLDYHGKHPKALITDAVALHDYSELLEPKKRDPLDHTIIAKKRKKKAHTLA